VAARPPRRGTDPVAPGRLDRRDVRERIVSLWLDRSTQVAIRRTLARELGVPPSDANLTRLVRSVVEHYHRAIKPGAYRHESAMQHRGARS
jgi:hypothetical protein